MTVPWYAVRLLPDGSLAYEGMSREAFGLSFRCEAAWWRFRVARKVPDFGGMVAAEMWARSTGDRLATTLQAEGWSDAQIAELLRRHQHGPMKTMGRRFLV